MKHLILALAFLTSFAALADDDLKPAQEEAKEKFETEIADGLKAMNEKCGTKIAMTVDWKNYNDEAVKAANISFSSYCSGALIDPVVAMCDRPAYKKAIAKKLTALKCLVTGGKAKGKDQSSADYTMSHMKFEKGTFTYNIQFDHSNLGDNGKAVLEKAFN